MGIPYDLRPCLVNFMRKITAYDVTGIIGEDGIYHIQQKNEDYTFFGVLIPPKNETIQFYENGEIKNGDMSLYTFKNRILFFHDAVNFGEEQIQTFIKYRNGLYRVVGQSPRDDDGVHQKYILQKYLDRDNL